MTFIGFTASFSPKSIRGFRVLKQLRMTVPKSIIVFFHWKHARCHQFARVSGGDVPRRRFSGQAQPGTRIIVSDQRRCPLFPLCSPRETECTQPPLRPTERSIIPANHTTSGQALDLPEAFHQDNFAGTACNWNPRGWVAATHSFASRRAARAAGARAGCCSVAFPQRAF